MGTGQRTTSSGKGQDVAPRGLTNDLGWVHYNSGISNLAFYLLSQGGVHPRLHTGVEVPALGIEKAQQIYYGALPYLNENSGFAQMRQATACAAIKQFPATNYSNPEMLAVCKAWDAVGVPLAAPGNGICPNKVNEPAVPANLCPTPPPTVGDPPPPPTNVWAASEHCHGLNTVHWSGTGDSFEIYTFASSETAIPGAKVYAGAGSDESTGHAAFVTLGEGAIVRVRACNAAGCGAFSDQTGTGHSSSGCS